MTATTVTVAIPGATGRMGQELLEAAAEREDVTVGVATSRTPEAGPVAGQTVEPAADLPATLVERDIDVLVDFTVPAATNGHVEAAADAGVGAVVGTTGFDDEATLRGAAERIPILKAANFARGIQALLAVLETAAEALPGYDVELIETHHNGKRDAPSGTAGRLLETIDAAREDDGKRVHGREGHSPRSDGEIGVHALRAGDITGIHEALFAGQHEELRITHRAEDRGVFAAGALDAAVWLAGRDPGWYAYEDLLNGF
jgi:4-hydroxy-tetrahydrodipicolinate reductase